MRRKSVVGLAAVLLAVAGVVTVVRKQHEIGTLPRPHQIIPAVQVASVTRGALEVTAHYLGTVEPYKQADLSARISGNVLSIAKREGDAVRAGEVVAVIDDRELVERSIAVNAEMLASRQRMIGAQSTYETQKAIYARDEKLFAAGAISREALERSRAALDGTKATVAAYEESIKGLTMNAAAAQTQAGYARIESPLAGVVTRRWMEPGDMAIPGKPILSVEGRSPYKVTIEVPQEELQGLRRGGSAHLSNRGKTLSVKISRIYPALGRNILGLVEMVMPAPPFGLPTGSTVGVDLVREVVTGAIVPEDALMKSTSGSFVCVISAGTVHLRKVTVLGTQDGSAAVSGAVTAGEQVAFGQENRLLTLGEGSRVTVSGGPR